jgi:hypothetical protein
LFPISPNGYTHKTALAIKKKWVSCRCPRQPQSKTTSLNEVIGQARLKTSPCRQKKSQAPSVLEVLSCRRTVIDSSPLKKNCAGNPNETAHWYIVIQRTICMPPNQSNPRPVPLPTGNHRGAPCRLHRMLHYNLKVAALFAEHFPRRRTSSIISIALQSSPSPPFRPMICTAIGAPTNDSLTSGFPVYNQYQPQIINQRGLAHKDFGIDHPTD